MAEIKTVLKGSPERIYLVIEDGNGEQPFGSFSEACKMARQEDGLIWCEDSQGQSDIAYVRSDIVDGLIEAAVLSANAGKVSDGFVLVPVEPTEAMIQAACLHQSREKFDSYDAWWNSHSSGVSERIRNLLVDDYKAMIAAAPTQQAIDAGKV